MCLLDRDSTLDNRLGEKKKRGEIMSKRNLPLPIDVSCRISH